MRSVTFQSVLQGTARMLGLDVTRDLSPARAASLTEYINNRVKEGWEFEFWDEWTSPELRYYRPAWAANTNYAAGVELYYPASTGIQYVQTLQAANNIVPFDAAGNINSMYYALSASNYTAVNWAAGAGYVLGPSGQVYDPLTLKYYQCYIAHTSGAAMDYTKFGVLTPFNRYVGYDQPGQTPIGRVEGVYVNDPRVATRNPGKLPFMRSANGVQVSLRAPASVYVNFSLREPVFTTTAWNAATNYTGAMELVYVAPNCYASIKAGTNQAPASQPTYWSLAQFPMVLANFVKRAAMADALGDLKQQDRKTIELQGAYQELADAVDREMQSQGGQQVATAETYGSGR